MPETQLELQAFNGIIRKYDKKSYDCDSNKNHPDEVEFMLET